MNESANLIIGGMAARVQEQWILCTALCVLAIAGALFWRRYRALKAQIERERLLRQEVEAYSHLDVILPLTGSLREPAKQICKLITEKSVFARAALFILSRDGRLVCVGSSRMDDLTLAALERWGERMMVSETAAAPGSKAQSRSKSFPLVLGERAQFDAVAGKGRYEAIVAPMRMRRGRLVGAVAVCMDAFTHLPPDRLAEAAEPLEMLAAKLAGSVEQGLMQERLTEAERLAGVGQMVSGVVHELTMPLTAVLGFSELIAATATESRVRQDAGLLVVEAHRMAEILNPLRSFWRPSPKPVASETQSTAVSDVA